jgi:16S rRNA C967 or C1407 C5-methylase (RsmB/RsmF family)
VQGRVRLQRALLTNAFRCLDTGGVLIYCVCSLEPAEGEEQVSWALDSLPGLELYPVTADEMAGLESAVDQRGLVRTHPGMAPGGQAMGEWTDFFCRAVPPSLRAMSIGRHGEGCQTRNWVVDGQR